MTMTALEQIKLQIEEKISKNDLNTALHLIIKFTTSIVFNQQAAATVFGSRELDDLCIKIGGKNLALQNLIEQKEVNEDLVLYVVTEVYKIGGHTAVLEDLIKAQPEKQHIIVVTNTFNTADHEVINLRFNPLGVGVVWAPSSTLIDKLTWLQNYLIQKQPYQVFLLNHHQDAVAIAGVHPKLVNQLTFYHHCDHQLCLGLYLPHAKHIDPHPFGFHNCTESLGVVNTIYVPLTVEDLGARSPNMPFMVDGRLRTCSSGGRNKFEQPYIYSYAEEIANILESTDGFHIHIGSLSSAMRELIKDKLCLRKIDEDRFIYIPWVKSLWKTLHEQKVDIYISSFPYGGGRASVEVMGSGTPFVGHYNQQSTLLSGAGIHYPEAFFWKEPAELHQFLKNVTPELLKLQSFYSRRFYEKNHKPEVLRSCLNFINNKVTNSLPSPPASANSFVDSLKSFIIKTSLDTKQEFVELIDLFYPILDQDNLFLLDKARASAFLFDIQETANQLNQLQADFEEKCVGLEHLQRQFQQLQIELAQAHHQHQLTQAQLNQTQTQLNQTQTQLNQTQNQLNQTQAQLSQTQFQLEQTQSELHQVHSQLYQTQVNLLQAETTIAAMESSKFWKIRNSWLKLKRRLRLEAAEEQNTK